MEKHKSVIFIGRFQPLHLGHERVIRELIKRFGRITIGVGSSNESRTHTNPFDYSERKHVLNLALSDLKGKYSIIPVEDILSDATWTKHVLSLGNFTHFVSGNAHVAKCLKGKLVRIKEPGPFNRRVLQATRVRARIRQDSIWHDRLNPKVATYLRKIGAKKIILSI